MKNGQRQYHHGNLRQTLIEAAVEVLATEPLETFSLRRLAKAAGVSHNAPYMHFPDKEALLTAVADEGFRKLSSEIQIEISDIDDWRERLICGCWAYVRFALERPVQMRMMFRPTIAGVVRHSSEVGATTFNILVDEIEAAIKAGHMRDLNSRAVASMFWSIMHGFADIAILTGIAPGGVDNISKEEQFRWMMEQQLWGLSV